MDPSAKPARIFDRRTHFVSYHAFEIVIRGISTSPGKLPPVRVPALAATKDGNSLDDIFHRTHDQQDVLLGQFPTDPSQRLPERTLFGCNFDKSAITGRSTSTA